MFEHSYPIAEIFDSIQGEGVFTGASMTFLRLAGCTVGKPYTKEERKLLPVLQPYQERCTDWSNNSFACDTNYKMARKYTVAELLDVATEAHRVCLTGGEPLMHNIRPLISALLGAGKKVHIETSGTHPLEEIVNLSHLADKKIWICVSPKHGYLQESLLLADEIKVLVGSDFNEELFHQQFDSVYPSGKVFIQPINAENDIDFDNVTKCLELQSRWRKLRLSLQLHKVLRVR